MNVIRSIFREKAASYPGPQTPNSGGFESYPLQAWLIRKTCNWYSFCEKAFNLLLATFCKVSESGRNLSPDLAATLTQPELLL